MIKFAELSNTHTMPASAPPDPSTQSTKAVVQKKTAQVPSHDGMHSHLVPGHKGEDPDKSTDLIFDDGGTPGTQLKSLPQQKLMKPHVDVTAQEPPTVIHEKKASVYAMKNRYPLDSYAQVKQASAYFDEWWKAMPFEDRHEYAVNMVKRADELGITVSDTARKYGSEKYASSTESSICLDARRILLQDEKHLQLLDKVAAQRGTIPVDDFCELVSAFDKTAGLDHHYDRDVPDPYLTTYGWEKKAEFSEVIGNQMVTADDLKFLAANRIMLVKGTFDKDLAEEFKKDPVGIYKSLPMEQRKVFATMARANAAHDPLS